VATGDACRPIRYAAIERCSRFAIAHPAWFEPRHYTKLLPLLSDDDPQIRAGAMKTFQALAGFRSQQVATVVGDIAARIHGDAAGGDEAAEVEARRNLEIALGITMDRLVYDVEQLQKDVQVLEARRGELLQYIETQAIRVGEEIHHEVLNTLTGYLATAIDEGNYAESRTWLEALIQELRRIMNNLYPRDLETEGFLETIRNRLRYAKQHLERRGRRCEVVLDSPPGITDGAIAASAGGSSQVVLLYRIVLEAISNARKHSGGTFIGVSVRAPAPGAIEIRISDNGAAGGGPFSENAGMALTRRRAEEIGAGIEYQSTPDGGTAVVIRLGNAAPRTDGGSAPLEDAARREVEGDGEARPAT
jgi:signal transduction histidine kinase